MGAWGAPRGRAAARRLGPRAWVAGLGLLAALLWAGCAEDRSGEPGVLTVEVDAGALRYERYTVILVDSLGADTLWDDSVGGIGDLRRLPTERYRGQPATVILEGWKAGARVYVETRSLDPSKPPAAHDTVLDASARIAAFAWTQRQLKLAYGDSSKYDTLGLLPAKADRRVRVTLSDSSRIALRDSGAIPAGLRFRVVPFKAGTAWIHAVSLADTALRDSVQVIIATGTVSVPQPVNLTPRWQNDSLPRWTWRPGGTGAIPFYDVRLDDDGLAGELVGDTTWIAKSPLADGPHTLYVRAQDAADQLSQPAGMVVLVDTKAPAAPLVANAALPATDNPRPSWIWTPQGGGMGRFRVKLDDSVLATGATAVDSLKFTARDSLPLGPHTLYVQEADSAGNWSASGKATVTVVAPDKTPPGKPFRQSIFYGTQERFTWLSGGGGAGVYRYLVDKTDFDKDGPTETVNAWFAPGPGFDTAQATHQLYVQERDSVGNWSEAAQFPFTAYRFIHIRSRADSSLVLAVAADSVNIVSAPLILDPKNAAEDEALRRQLWMKDPDARVPAPHHRWTNLFLNAQLKHRGYGKQAQLEGFSGTDVDTAKFWRTEQIAWTGGTPPPWYHLSPLAGTERLGIQGDVRMAGKPIILWEHSGGEPNELWLFRTYAEKWYIR